MSPLSKLSSLSLKLKIGITVLLLFLCSIWLLTFFISTRLAHDMTTQIEAQQFSAASYIADSIENQVKLRISSLNDIASLITPALLANPNRLRVFLKGKSLLSRLFQTGVIILSKDGKVITDYPALQTRAGSSLAHLEYFQDVVASGKPAVGKPRVGIFSMKPVVGFAVPVFDRSGHLIAVLAGFTLLSDPALLGTIESSIYKEFPDRLLLISPKYRMIITGSDPTRIMTPTPKPGLNPLFDKYAAGFEGSGITVDARGVRILSSVKYIPTPGWFIRVGLPAKIAFAPIRKMNYWAYSIALGLSLISSLLVWLVIRQALRPLSAASKLIQDITEERLPLQNIPVTQYDEVGQLLTSFNVHLNYRKLLDKALTESEKFLQTIIETEPECIKLLDADGTLLKMNRAGLSMIEADSLEQVKGQSVYPLVTEEYREAFKLLTEDVFRGKSGTLEFKAVGLKGKHVWLETHAVPLRNEKDEIVALLGITRDVTEHKRMEEQLKKDHENFLKIFSAAPVGLLLLNRETVIIEANEAIRGMVLREPAQVIGMRAGGGLGCIHSLEDPRGCGFSISCPDCNLRRGIENTLSGGSNIHGALVNLTLLIAGSPQQRWLSISAEPYQIDGQPNVIVAIDDYTDRKHTEEALRISEVKFKSLFNSINDAILILDLQGHIIEANNVACDRLGYDKEELLRMAPSDFDTPEYANLVHQRIKQIKEDGELIFETAQVRRDGTVIPTEVNCRIVEYEGRPAMLGICRDITDRKHAEERTRQSLREKDTLLKEIHHRVKNNLAIVASLLALQANRIQDDTLKAILEDSQQRIKAMALVHEELYKTTNFARINFENYINTIVSELMYSYDLEGRKIITTINIKDITLDLQSAIPCGLLVNELLTNAFKYAFPGGRSGEIVISLIRIDDTYTLTIKDNGIGLPQGFDYTQTKTLGLQLVNVLANQLGGTLHIRSEAGTEAVIMFKVSHDNDVKRIID